MWQRSYDDSPTLYMVPTPIGNMGDFTFRAIDVLKSVEVVFSEDTRVTSILFNYYDIHKKLISLHNFNEETVKNNVLNYLRDGYSVAIVTDRGTPVISDPGYKSVKYVSDMGYNVVCLPGSCAFVPALVNSGISSSHFYFYGFLSSKVSQKKKELNDLKFFRDTIIFYESPHRILETMNLIMDIFGDRVVSLSREISKKFESVYRGNISNLLPDLVDIKGEFVVVVSGFDESNLDCDNDISIIDKVNYYISNGLSSMDAIKLVAKERELSKSEVYKEYHTGGRK